MKVEIKRIYDVTDDIKGYRVLVDRVWPRGISQASLKLDEWDKEIAPSTELRKWFGHDPERWESFRLKFMKELKEKPELLKHLRDIAKEKQLVLLYSAKDLEKNQAVVIRNALISKE